MDTRGIGGITPPSQDPFKAHVDSNALKGNQNAAYDSSKDPFHNYILNLMGPELGTQFWNLYTKSVQEACRKAIQKAQARAQQALKEAKNA